MVTCSSYGFLFSSFAYRENSIKTPNCAHLDWEWEFLCLPQTSGAAVPLHAALLLLLKPTFCFILLIRF